MQLWRNHASKLFSRRWSLLVAWCGGSDAGGRYDPHWRRLICHLAHHTHHTTAVLPPELTDFGVVYSTISIRWVSASWDDHAEGGERVDREYRMTEAGDEERSADETCVNFQVPESFRRHVFWRASSRQPVIIFLSFQWQPVKSYSKRWTERGLWNILLNKQRNADFTGKGGDINDFIGPKIQGKKDTVAGKTENIMIGFLISLFLSV